MSVYQGRYNVRPTPVIAVNLATRLVKAKANRVGIIIACPGVPSVNIWPTQDVAASIGILLNTNNPAREYIWTYHGDLVMGEWWAVSLGGATAVSVIEIEEVQG